MILFFLIFLELILLNYFSQNGSFDRSCCRFCLNSSHCFATLKIL
ncbi:hypothetical protein LEP1GSC021_2112 [Leptospira noguchii str. 1993005606]|nr:hypothetical protein LEP1GSC021_2112 [Leptospira noguchii str. 1993005606]